jgi:hypothetical protein
VLAIAERDYGLVPMSLSANSRETPLGLGGYDRPREVVENGDEIVARYRESRRPVLECAYCGERIKDTLRLDDALRWFRTHACEGEGEIWRL